MEESIFSCYFVDTVTATLTNFSSSHCLACNNLVLHTLVLYDIFSDSSIRWNSPATPAVTFSRYSLFHRGLNFMLILLAHSALFSWMWWTQVSPLSAITYCYQFNISKNWTIGMAQSLTYVVLKMMGGMKLSNTVPWTISIPITVAAQSRACTVFLLLRHLTTYVPLRAWMYACVFLCHPV
jgi:hypothetical protein